MARSKSRQRGRQEVEENGKLIDMTRKQEEDEEGESLGQAFRDMEIGERKRKTSRITGQRYVTRTKSNSNGGGNV